VSFLDQLAGWFLALLAAGFVALLVVARRRVSRGGRAFSSAAAEVDALFAASRRHVVEYHHVQQMRRADVGDEGDPGTLRWRVGLDRGTAAGCARGTRGGRAGL